MPVQRGAVCDTRRMSAWRLEVPGGGFTQVTACLTPKPLYSIYRDHFQLVVF